MASIARDRGRDGKPNGFRTLQVVCPDGKRRKIALGKMTAKQAEFIKAKVEHVAAGKISGQAMPNDVAEWLRDVDEALHNRLAKIGLIAPRVHPERHRLVKFVSAYIDRTAAKDSTKGVWRRAGNHLVEHFGDVEIAAINVGDAKDFRQYLLAETDTSGKPKKSLAENTTRKVCGIARQMFADAIDRELIVRNPFKHKDIPTATGGNDERQHFITREVAGRVLEQCPNVEWRLIFALSRFGGLRCPSEHLGLRWADVDWARGRMLVHSPKTRHHKNGESREVPLFPELRPHLEDAFQLAPDGTEFVIRRYRDTNSNLRTQLTKIIKRAGLTTWPRLFNNLRSSRETELAEKFPLHVVVKWLGNSEVVAGRHYLQTIDSHFDQAIEMPGQVTGHIPGQYRPESGGNGGKPAEAKQAETPGKPVSNGIQGHGRVVLGGLEPPIVSL